jgi:hypothetical protein
LPPGAAQPIDRPSPAEHGGHRDGGSDIQLLGRVLIDAVTTMIHAPVAQVLLWVVIAALAAGGLPKRYRLLSISASGGIIITALRSVGAFLQQTIPEEAAAIVEILLVLVGLILFFGPIAIAGDRLLRIAWHSVVRRGRRLWSYSLGAATGLAATAASFVGIWWVNDVHAGLQGNFDLAIYGGVFASCLALVRADRELDAEASGSGAA